MGSSRKKNYPQSISNPIISACGCSMFIAFLHYFPNNLSNFAWRQPQRAAHRATITVKKTAHARHVSALRRSTVSHSLSSAHARSPANYTTPHHTTHTEQHTRFESASQSRAPTHTSAAAKSSFETEPSCAGDHPCWSSNRSAMEPVMH